jgi:hypothetical protein
MADKLKFTGLGMAIFSALALGTIAYWLGRPLNPDETWLHTTVDCLVILSAIGALLSTVGIMANVAVWFRGDENG